MYRCCLIAWVAAGVAGCGGTTPPVQNESTPIELDCARRNQPCSLSEVPLEVLERGHDLGVQLIDMLHDGDSMAQALAWIAGQDGIVEAHGDDHALRFCLQGGRDVWILGPGSLAVDADRAAGGDPGGARTAHFVVGDDPVTKRGLVLAPFRHDFGGFDSAAPVADVLRGTRGYGSTVTYAENATAQSTAVGVSNFMDWDSYDAIHVSSHGSTICIDALCSAVILTGDTYSTGLELLQITEAGMNTVQSADTGGAYYAVGADFFRKHYPGGLNRKVVFVDACETVGAGDSDLALAIVGESSVYIGWNAPVQSQPSKEAALALFGHMSERGSTAVEAWHDLGNLQVNSYIDARGMPVSAGLQLTQREGMDARLREVVTWRDPDDLGELTPNGTLEFSGTADDGIIDAVPYVIDVDGITDDTVEGFTLHVVIDGVTADPVPLSEATAIGGYTRRAEGIVVLDVDLTAGQEVDLYAWVELPEGGRSEHRVAQRVEDATTDEPQLIEVWEGQARNVFVGTLTDQTRDTTIDLRFERTPSPSYAPYLQTFRPVYGHITFSMSGSVVPFFDDRCSYSFGPIEFDIAPSDGRLEIDTRTSPASYTAFGSTTGPEIRVAEECGDYAFSTAPRPVWIAAIDTGTYFVSQDGSTITGMNSDSRNSWQWTLTRRLVAPMAP